MNKHFPIPGLRVELIETLYNPQPGSCLIRLSEKHALMIVPSSAATPVESTLARETRTLITTVVPPKTHSDITILGDNSISSLPEKHFNEVKRLLQTTFNRVERNIRSEAEALEVLRAAVRSRSKNIRILSTTEQVNGISTRQILNLGDYQFSIAVWTIQELLKQKMLPELNPREFYLISHNKASLANHLQTMLAGYNHFTWEIHQTNAATYPPRGNPNQPALKIGAFIVAFFPK